MSRGPYRSWGSPRKDLRVRAGFTQATLASRAGISERTVRNWESGVHETDAFSRKAIERVLSEPKPAKPGVAGFALAMPKPAKP